MNVDIISPDGIVLHAEADFVRCRSLDGELGILPRHAPLIALIPAGTITLSHNDARTTVNVAAGLLKVLSNKVTFLVEHAVVHSSV